MMSTVMRRVGVTLAAGVVLGAAWSGTASAAPAESTATNSAGAVAATSGEDWCGFDYDFCVQEHNAYQHYGYHVSPLYNAGIDNTCVPERACNGYWFKWWE